MCAPVHASPGLSTITLFDDSRSRVNYEWMECDWHHLPVLVCWGPPPVHAGSSAIYEIMYGSKMDAGPDTGGTEAQARMKGESRIWPKATRQFPLPRLAIKSSE